jgi:hypothetical protein
MLFTSYYFLIPYMLNKSHVLGSFYSVLYKITLKKNTVFGVPFHVLVIIPVCLCIHVVYNFSVFLKTQESFSDLSCVLVWLHHCILAHGIWIEVMCTISSGRVLKSNYSLFSSTWLKQIITKYKGNTIYTESRLQNNYVEESHLPTRNTHFQKLDEWRIYFSFVLTIFGFLFIIIV